MMFWLAAALLAAGAVVLLIRPLRDRTSGHARRPDLAVYKDQLAEVARDVERGLITADQAQAARTEIAHRMLAAAGPGDPVPPSRFDGRALALGLMVLVPALALALYLPNGRPDLPSRPFAGGDPGAVAAERELTAAVDALARQLAAQPDNAAGWVALGERYTALARHAEAAEAYGRAASLRDGDPAVTGAYAEALVRAADGMVTETARLAFERVLTARPADPRALYYLAEARHQAGDLEGALDRWVALARGAPPDALWLPTVRQRVADTAAQLGRDPATLLPPVGSASPSDIATGAEFTAADAAPQATMIRGMVDNLAARLERNPGDLASWLRLGESYQALNEPGRAVDAFRHAAELAPKDARVLSAYADSLLASAGGGAPPPAFMPVIERLHAVEPENIRALWFIGAKALAENRPDEAAASWRRILDQLEPGTEEHRALAERLEAIAGTN